MILKKDSCKQFFKASEISGHESLQGSLARFEDRRPTLVSVYMHRFAVLDCLNVIRSHFSFVDTIEHSHM